MSYHYVKKARKDYPDWGIKKGEPYYWWKFRYGSIHKSKTPPKKWQLTQSEFLQTVYEIEDEIDDINIDVEDKSVDDIESEIEEQLESIKSEIEDLRDEQDDRLNNMPEQLQDTSDAGMLLQDRIDNLESWYDCLDNVDVSIEDDLTGEELEERVEEITDEIQDCTYEGE
ncbi:MAG: hypothetical protein GWP09_01745 [Nitrospiraceae bacterium]|nr:hypothetical protein [Nitrospiraceae bacterium]